ncbi:MAG: HEAT repeat domain-containing protein [Armatimonadota bacterium]
MEPKAQTAERLLRGLGVAVKTFALYPPPHPVTVKAIETLMGSLRGYTAAYGPFATRVGKYSLSVDGIPFKSGAHANLAFYLFTRKLSYFKFMPAVSEQALTAFVAAVGTDRHSLEAAGGIRHLLRQSGVGNIQVTEMVLEQDDAESESIDLSGIFEMLGRGRAAPQERERVIELLHQGPDQARVLLENMYAMAGGSPEGPIEDDQIQQVYQAVRSLDRMVLDEPFEDQPQLYANLAGAQVLLRDPLRSVLLRALIQRDGSNGSARRLGNQLSDEQIAQAVQDLLSGGNIEQQVTTFLRALCSDRQKAKAVLAILDAKLRPANANPNWLADAVLPQLFAQPLRRDVESPPEFEFGDLEVAAGRQDVDLRLKETRSIDEAAAFREVIMTLADVIRHEADEKDQREAADIADALMASMAWLVEHQEFGLLARILNGIKQIASSESGSRRVMAADILKKTAEGPLLDGLLAVMWSARETVVEKEIQTCLQPLAQDLVGPLVRALGTEPRGGPRAMLCDLIISLDGDSLDELGAYVTDSRWYLVRNIVNILGRVRHAQAVAYLSRLGSHPDYRVRRETLIALATIGTEEAQGVLATFLDDPDERLRLRAMQSLDTWEAWRAMPKILAVLERPDLFNRQFTFKQAALEALARLGAKQSLPAVNKIARARLVFGSRGRELRRLAALTASIIEGQRALPDHRVLSSDDRERRAP